MSRPAENAARCGPPTASGRAPRRSSRAGRWRALVLVLVHVAIALHVAHWLSSGETVSPLEPSEAMEFSKRGVINAGLVFFALSILTTGLFGRFVCGWACHLVAVQDLARWLLLKVGIRPRPLRSRLLLVVPFLAFGYMFLWPLAHRLWAGQDIGATQTALTKTDFWETFPPWPVAVFTLGVAGFAIIYFLGAKGFCTYACPYGAIFAVADRVAPWRIRVDESCEGCGHCTAACTSNVLVHAEVRDYGMVVDPGCMKCLDCVSVCPNGALSVSFGRPALGARPRAERRGGKAPIARSKWRRWKELALGEELLAGALFCVAFVCFRGLYGKVPFLLALAIAGILAYVGLLGWRLWRRSDVRLQRASLKLDGRLTRKGALFVALGAVLLLSSAHAAWLQVETSAVDRVWYASSPLRDHWFGAARPIPTDEQRRELERALDRARRVESLGVLETRGLSRRIAWLGLMLGREAEFERRLEEQAERAPHDALVRIELGDRCASLGLDEDARRWYRAAIDARPAAAEGFVRLGQSLATGGAVDQARAVFAEGLERHPHDLQLLYSAGTAATWQRDLDAAEARFRAVLALRPDFLPARENLAGTLCTLGRFEEGAEQFERALEQGEQLGTLLRAARARGEAGQLERAEHHARRAAELAPERPEPLELLADLARRRGDEDGAAELEVRARAARAASAPSTGG